MRGDSLTIDDVRPSVKAFAVLMERKLRENDWKGGWEEVHITELIDRTSDEARELRDLSLRAGLDRGPEPDLDAKVPYVTEGTLREDIAGECVDVANYAMMVAHVAGCLREPCGDCGDTGQFYGNLNTACGCPAGEAFVPRKDP